MKKTNKGITLIALVITIVVLLILAMVSINLVMNGGIIAHAENATSNYKIEEEKERIALAYAEYKMAKLSNPSATLQVEGASNVSKDVDNSWTVKFDNNVYKIDKQGTITYVESGKEGNEEIVIAEEKDLAMVNYIYNTMHNPKQPEIVPVDGYYDDEDNNKISDINSELPAFLAGANYDIPASFFKGTIPTQGDITATIIHYDGTEEEIKLITVDNKKWVYESEGSPLMSQDNIRISIRPYSKYKYIMGNEKEDRYEDNIDDYHYMYINGRNAIPFEKLKIFDTIIEFSVKCQAKVASGNIATEEIYPMYNNIDNINKMIVNFSDSTKVEYTKENIFNAEAYAGDGFYYTSTNVPVLYENGMLYINMIDSSFKKQITSIIIEENGLATQYNVSNSTMVGNTPASN